MKAYLFPGQGSQFEGMGKRMYFTNKKAKSLFDLASNLLNRDITSILFEGSQETLQRTDVTQLAIFLYSVILAKIDPNFNPSMVAGHSLGEFSALVCSQVIEFKDGLHLIAIRADAMKHACELTSGTMMAVIGMPDAQIEEICNHIDDVVLANYNCPGQLVLSGSIQGIQLASEKLKQAGAKKLIPLKVQGAFHSHFMEPARIRLAQAIEDTAFYKGICPIYQNVSTLPETDPKIVKKNLINQLTAPIQWTRTIRNMIKNGATQFIECGPGNVLQGLVRKIDHIIPVVSLEKSV